MFYLLAVKHMKHGIPALHPGIGLHPYIEGCCPNHCTTREVPLGFCFELWQQTSALEQKI